MKRFVFVIGVALLFAAAALAREQPVLARVTVYWASGGGGSDACTRQHKCATGARLGAGHCAVDPKKIPYGSKVVFPDTECVAVDTGRDVISRAAARRSGRTAAERNALVIDRFFETKRQALAWASSHPHFMTVRILGPYEQSSEKQNSAGIRNKNDQVTPKPNFEIAAKQRMWVTGKRDAEGISKSVAQNGTGIAQTVLVAQNNNKSRGWQLPKRF